MSIFNPLVDSDSATPTAWDNLVATWYPEVQGQYHANLAVSRLVQKKTIPTGKTAQFMLTGRVGGAYHDSGDEFRGFTREQMVRNIDLYDRPFYSALEEEDLVRLVEQVPAERAERTREIAYRLSKYTEIETMKMLTLAARDTGPTNASSTDFHGGFGTGTVSAGAFDGTGITGTFGDNAAGAQELLSAIDSYLIGRENYNVSWRDTYCVVTPELWYQLRKLDTFVSGGTGTAGSAGVFNDMNINPNPIHFSTYLGMEVPLVYNGVMIMRHSLFRGSNDGGEGFAQDRTNDRESAGDFSNTKAILWSPNAIGFVDKLGPTTTIERPSRTDNELVRSKIWIGGGTVMPEYACELKTS